MCNGKFELRRHAETNNYVVYVNVFITNIFKAKTLLRLVCENEKMTPNEPVVAVVDVVVTVLTVLTVGVVNGVVVAVVAVEGVRVVPLVATGVVTVNSDAVVNVVGVTVLSA